MERGTTNGGLCVCSFIGTSTCLSVPILPYVLLGITFQHCVGRMCYNQEAILSAPSQQSDPTVVWISDVYLVPDYEAHDGDMQEAVAIAVPER